MSHTAEQPRVRYEKGVTFMSSRDTNLIVGNDTRTEPAESFTVPSPQRVGRMSAEEADAEAQSGWSPVREHRRADPPVSTTFAVAEVVSDEHDVVSGEVRAGGTRVPHISRRVGRRVVLRKEGSGTPYTTVRNSRAETVQPADLPHMTLKGLRDEVEPDLWPKGAPTEQSMRRVGQPVVNAMQFVLEKGADLLHRLERDPEQFIKEKGADMTHKIRKEPLRSQRHKERAPRNKRAKPQTLVGADGVFF